MPSSSIVMQNGHDTAIDLGIGLERLLGAQQVHALVRILLHPHAAAAGAAAHAEAAVWRSISSSCRAGTR